MPMQADDRGVEDAAIVYLRNSTRLVRQHRLDLAERNAPGPVLGSALLDKRGHQPTDKLSRNRRE